MKSARDSRDAIPGIILIASLVFVWFFVTRITIPCFNYFFAEKTFFNSDLKAERKQALPIEAVRTHEPEYKWVEYARNQDTIYLYRVPVAVKIVADSTTHGTGKLIIQYSYK